MGVGGGRWLGAAVVVSAVLFAAAACGSSGSDPGGDAAASGDPSGTTVDPSTAEHWVAGELPDSYGPVLLTEEPAGGSTIYYAPSDAEHDLYDSPLRVTVAAEDDLTSMAHSAAETVDVNGHEATVLTLTDEGRAYGFAVGWQQAPGRWLGVEGLDDLGRDEVVAIARDLQPVDAAEWDRLRRALSIDTRIGKVDPDATPVEALSGTIDGETWTLTALVPSGYPLGPEDQRRDCFRLTFRGESSGDKCDDHPFWTRIGGQLFVFGPAEPDTSEVTIGPYRDLPDAPFTVPTATVDQGPPNTFYAAPLPDGRCYVTITPASDPNLGDMGAGPGDPEQAACLEQLNG